MIPVWNWSITRSTNGRIGAKAHITELYQSEYAPAPAPEDDDEYAGDDDDYRASLFKKRRVARANELDDYLNAEIALPGTQILEWWQV